MYDVNQGELGQVRAKKSLKYYVTIYLAFLQNFHCVYDKKKVFPAENLLSAGVSVFLAGTYICCYVLVCKR